ncbi:MAG: hypothetical protein FJW95_09255 [Actinobacteria bacterium]|nr:hypothetical protein [Actinomycetota bacterium]
MAILVILVLVVLWAAVLIPPILRSRNSGGHHGVSDFMDSLRSLGHRGSHHRSSSMLGGPVLHGPLSGPPPMPRGPRQAPLAPPMHYRPMPGGVSPMMRRRRNVLFGLTAAVGLTFLLALGMRTPFAYLLFLVAAAALGAYCYALVQIKNHGALTRTQPAKRAFVTPVDVEDDASKAGDNVIVLRRNVG